ncbi:hypothetical protein DC914_RS21800, partial [Vibrio parahaemolyticus]|nr:hypothetical protein [Vibrio parahaemolyticus]
YASDFFTVNTGSPEVKVAESRPEPVKVESETQSEVIDEHNGINIEQQSDFIRNTVAKKQMSLYNFATNKEETFMFEEIDNDVNYARKFIPPSEDVIAMFDYFVEEGASPGTALLLTYKKLDEAIQSLNDSSANK